MDLSLSSNGFEENSKPIPIQLNNSNKQSTTDVGLTKIWFDWYEKEIGRKPQFNGVSGKNLKSIAKKIESLRPEIKVEEFFLNILEFREKMPDQWLKENMLDLKIFDSKFDLIINNIKKVYDKGHDRKNRYASY